MNGARVLEIRGLNKTFGGVNAIDGFNLSLEDGTIHGLIGPNGAGKTTIFNVITGIYTPTGGTVVFLGRDITALPPHRIAAGGIGRTFQNIRLFGNLGVLKNIIIAGSAAQRYPVFDAVLRLPAFTRAEKELRERAVFLLEAVGLADKRDERANNLPYGHQRRLEIARALALNPKLLLLDEPAAGMNAAESLELVRFIKNIRDTFKLAVLMIEHHMDVVTELCEKVTVLNFGKIIAEGKLEDVRREARVIEAYLGSRAVEYGVENLGAV
jgi:branched-chain amino acid transport system ATP-binding protein